MCCLLFACCLLFMCCLPDTCCLLFVCRFLVASRVASLHMSPVFMCCCCRTLSSSAVSGWWCWAFAAAHGAGPSSLSMGWPTHHSPVSMRRTWCGHSSCLLSGVHCHPGAANKVSEGGGGDDDRVAAHIPQHPHHVHGMGAPLVCYPACTVVLGLQKRLVRWGVMTTGGHSPSPAPHLFAALVAPSSVALRGVLMRGVDSGQHHCQRCGTLVVMLAVVKSGWWWWWRRKGNKLSCECDHPANSRHGNI